MQGKLLRVVVAHYKALFLDGPTGREAAGSYFSAHTMIYPTAKMDLLHSSRRCLQQPSRSRYWCHIHIPIACCPRPLFVTRHH